MHLKYKINKGLSIIVSVAICMGILVSPVQSYAKDCEGNQTIIQCFDDESDYECISGDYEELEEEDNYVYALDTSQAIWDVLTLVNNERASIGLSALVMDKRLVATANIRANEIVTKFDHSRPDGTSCWTAFSEDVHWAAVGENIAAGQYSAAEVMEDWMNSSGHRANILSANYNCIGIACVYVPGSEYGYYWVQDFGNTKYPETYSSSDNNSNNNNSSQTITSNGINVSKSDRYGFTASMQVSNPGNDTLQYAWYGSKDEGQTWHMIDSWTTGSSTLTWTPSEYGEWQILGMARKKNDTTSEVKATTSVSYHPYIKDKCQMPYWGPGGGYLIGFESYENPNQEYQYEMFVMDLSLLAAGSPTPWVHRTYPIKLAAGATPADGKTLWTIWQPQYGYYLTLFRLYDKDGNTIDEVCYGFANAY